MSDKPAIVKLSNAKQITVDHHPQPNTISLRADMVVTTEGLSMQEILMVMSERTAQEVAEAIARQLKRLRKGKVPPESKNKGVDDWDFLD